MLKQVRHLIAFAWLAAALLMSAGVHAASLEKIEVASRLGEPFYAEIPLKLEANESVSRIFVEIAGPADYKIFEVYREPVLNSIRADVASDQRGTRVELSSRTAIDAPFINLVLKIRYGRVAHFKKFPIFLEPPKTVQLAATKQPLPTVELTEQGDDATTAVAENVEVEPQAESVESVGAWARTDRYGPIVYGDILSTVAGRLRVDHRYTRNQVMAALLEKNRSKFEHENMNLLKSGSFLEVPTAAEVEQRTAKEAYKLFAEHEKKWKSLTSQARYAAVAQAQKTRYSKRVSIGEQAAGSAVVPLHAMPSVEAVSTVKGADAGAVSAKDVTAPVADEQAQAAQTQLETELSSKLTKLQLRNEELEQRLLENQQSITALNSKMDEVTAAASKARIEKLEVLLTRLQAELEKSNNAPRPVQGGPEWAIWLLLAALIVTVLALVAVLVRRREPKHPAENRGATEAVASGAMATAASVAAVSTVDADSDGKDKEPDVFDSISSFADDLTDTDTAEMEPFDASVLDEDPDPSVDYISEADVYIRYGMNDEALHQLGMALRLDPANADAHIKKLTLLNASGDQAAFDAAVTEAADVLDASQLEQLKALGAGDDTVQTTEVEVKTETEEQSANVIASPEPDVEAVQLLESPIEDGIDFDLSDIEVPDQQEIAARAGDAAEMDWLHDDSFDEAKDQQQSVLTDTDDHIAITTDEEGATQIFGNLLDEFASDEADNADKNESFDGLSQPEILEETLDLASVGATQDLDQLLSEFSEQDELTDSVAADETLAKSESTLVIDEDLGATQNLDHLLGEFADDDKMFDFGTQTGELDDSLFKQAEAAVAKGEGDDTSQFGATQHLDILMSEFAEDDAAVVSDELGLDDAVFEKTEDKAVEATVSEPDADHGATQELDHLLNEFAVSDESEASAEQQDAPEMDHGATQGLDHLLSEFATTEDGTAAVEGAENSGGIQELGHLLAEFSAAEEEEVPPEPEWLTEPAQDSEHGATQELDQLLSEFSDDDEDDGKQKG